MVRNSLLLLATISFVLLSGEIYYRLRHEALVRTLLGGRTDEMLLTRATSDGRIYELKPSTELTNDAGQRDLPRTKEKPDGVYRIAVIGDSVTMQETVSLEQLYIRQLENLLNGAELGRRFELLNFGVTGYNSKQELALLRHTVFSYSPDAILWQFHDNDSLDSSLQNADGGLVIYYRRPISYLFTAIDRRIRSALRRRFIRAHKLEDVPTELIDQLYYRDEHSALFREVMDECSSRGLPVFLFLYPLWPAANDWANYTSEGFSLHRELAQQFTGLGFQTLDLLPMLVTEDLDRLRSSESDPWHPSVAGHRWIADRLFAWLRHRVQADYGYRESALELSSP